jgi:hypothetical protein
VWIPEVRHGAWTLGRRARPGERTADVLIEMLTGTIRPAAEAAGAAAVQDARALLAAISDRTIADLLAALDA